MVLHISRIFQNVANDDGTFVFLYYISKISFYKCYLTAKKVTVNFASKW